MSLLEEAINTNTYTHASGSKYLNKVSSDLFRTGKLGVTRESRKGWTGEDEELENPK